MRCLLPLFLFVLLLGLHQPVRSQNEEPEGSVSFITTQNVYVRFTTTSGIKTGDTLCIQQGGTLLPALIVKDLSSTSCVCVPVLSTPFKVTDRIFRMPTKKNLPPKETGTPSPKTAVSEPVPRVVSAKPDTTSTGKSKEYKKRQQIHGFVNVAGYFNSSNISSGNSQSEKLTFSFSARNIGNSNLSAECYASYYQNDKQYNETKNSIFNSLKIYNLDLSYDFGKRATLSLGRKLNPKLSDMGSNDGLQFDLKFKPITIGLIAGFRPNYTDYGFTSSLFQGGAYLYNEVAGKKGFMQTTLAFINQTNSGKTDRRFFYFQHVNSLVKNLTFFGSLEVDIFGKVFNRYDSTANPGGTYKKDTLYNTVSTPRLTNLYVSLSYRILRKLNLSFSYSNYQNIIYYETYKTYLDRLLDMQSMQGYSLQANYSPVNNLSIGATAAYRFEARDPRATQNLYAYITYNRIPGILTSLTVSTILMKTAYLNGRIYSAGLSKDLAAGKLYLGLTYHYIDYHYANSEVLPTYQNMGEFSITWRIIRKLMLAVYYEGTFEKTDQYHRLYAQINMGF